MGSRRGLLGCGRNPALTEAEIKAMYNNGRGVKIRVK